MKSACQHLPVHARADEFGGERPSLHPTTTPRPGAPTPQITPNLWFDTESLEAAELYTSIFPNSEITNVSHYGDAGPRPAGTVLTVAFTLDGQPYTAINGGPEFPLTEAVSLLIPCSDQDEVDHYWNALSEGGEEGQCGWLKDRYGLSWQIVPAALGRLMSDPGCRSAPADGTRHGKQPARRPSSGRLFRARSN